jgi:hypothetical protein
MDLMTDDATLMGSRKVGWCVRVRAGGGIAFFHSCYDPSELTLFRFFW